MQLWNEHQKVLSKKMDMEKLLQVLECLAEDELFVENEIEIEQIEKVILKENKINESLNERKDSEGLIRRTETLMSAKMAVRMSIFTIIEGEDEDNSSEGDE